MSDLISREALKEALGEQIPNITKVNDFVIFVKLIEHAPTVNPCENCDLYFMAKTKEEMKKGGAE